MSSLINLLRISIIAAIIAAAADSAMAQTDDEVVSYFAKEQLEVRDNQTVFNVFRIENRTQRSQRVQVNITAPVDWELFGERTIFLDLPAMKTKSIPIRIAPSSAAKGGVGYALNASLLSMDGTVFASKYCFLTVPVRTDLKIDFSAISYYLDHRYGKAYAALNIKNRGNSSQLLGLKMFCDEHIEFSEIGQTEYNAEISLAPGRDTTVRALVRYNDMIENISHFNKAITATISAQDTAISKYSFVKYLDCKFDNYIEDADQPLVFEMSGLDILSEAITYRFLILGKLKFRNSRTLSYYYRSVPAMLKNIPDLKYDEYFLKYDSKKVSARAGNIRDEYMLGMFGLGASIKQQISGSAYVKASALRDVYSSSRAAGISVGSKIRAAQAEATYARVSGDSLRAASMHLLGAEVSSSLSKMGSLRIKGLLNFYSPGELGGKKGFTIDANYSEARGPFSLFAHLWKSSPYSATYNHGRTEISASLGLRTTRRSYIQAGFQRFKYQPASIYNSLSTKLNYHFSQASLRYNYILGKNSTLFAGPVFDLGESNYYGGAFADILRLGSAKAEIGYRYSPGLYALQSLNVSIQAGQMKPFQYCDTLPNFYYGETSNVLKFSATVQGKRWGVYGMYYSGLYNMNMALTNYYTGTAGKYLYFMPYFRITSANKMFYYEIRFSYLNNIDLKNTRTSIIQEAGADFGLGWSMRIQNNTNIQALQDATGQSYRYTSNYMEITLRKVFRWNQPGQKYHTLKTVFYRDLNGDGLKGDNEPGVENVVMSITNNSAVDTSYHFSGEMFGNVDVASNHKGVTEYRNIPEAKYYLKFQPSEYLSDRYSIQDAEMLVDLSRDVTLNVPFVERNLVFGTVAFNRAKRSAIQEIPLDGIKVSITDSQGRSWYAFTDQKGYYEIYAPVADFYTVQIANNVWTEHFSLRQDKYIIKFNGYKRFEVNFVFDEKAREIKFDDVIDIDDIVSGEDFRFEDVAQIKQTILQGTVSDETTLEPVQATIEIIDLARHNVVAKLKSSSISGSFYTAFIIGNNYQLRISAPGYWIYQEPLSAEQITTFETISRDGLLLKKISVGTPMALSSLVFDENSHDLSPEAKAELEDVAALLASNENVRIMIAGYCSQGENGPGALSAQRARNVSDFLILRGIPASRIAIQGRGLSSGSKTPAQQRRAEIIVTDKGRE